MDGSAGPPVGYALETILETETRQMGRALAHGRLTAPLVAHYAGQRRFARYSNRGASHERQALLVGTRAKLPAEFVRQAVANSRRAIPFRLSAQKRAHFSPLRLFARTPRARLLGKNGRHRSD